MSLREKYQADLDALCSQRAVLDEKIAELQDLLGAKPKSKINVKSTPRASLLNRLEVGRWYLSSELAAIFPETYGLGTMLTWAKSRPKHAGHCVEVDRRNGYPNRYRIIEVGPK